MSDRVRRVRRVECPFRVFFRVNQHRFITSCLVHICLKQKSRLARAFFVMIRWKTGPKHLSITVLIFVCFWLQHVSSNAKHVKWSMLTTAHSHSLSVNDGVPKHLNSSHSINSSFLMLVMAAQQSTSIAKQRHITYPSGGTQNSI